MDLFGWLVDIDGSTLSRACMHGTNVYGCTEGVSEENRSRLLNIHGSRQYI